MFSNLIRVAKVDSLPTPLPWKKSSFYKLHHLNRYPGLFVKVGGSLFVDLVVLDQIIEEGRSKKK